MNPDFLSARLEAQYKGESEKIFKGLGAKRMTSFRANTLKTSAESIESALASAQIPYERMQWYPDAFCVPPEFYSKVVSLPEYERGEIYLQSLSSMLPPLFLDPQPGERILDMTAAPGSKTTQISALSGGRALITACEKDKTRFERLNYNIRKQGAKNVVTMCTDAASLSEFFRFDKILLDAPCSGSGTKECTFSEKLLAYSLKTQQILLKKALSLLKEGGTLVYSTCSLLKEENEEQIFRADLGISQKISPLFLSFVPTLICASGMLTVCPDERFEGFFLAKIIK